MKQKILTVFLFILLSCGGILLLILAGCCVYGISLKEAYRIIKSKLFGGGEKSNGS